jgi:hypothetical protein
MVSECTRNVVGPWYTGLSIVLRGLFESRSASIKGRCRHYFVAILHPTTSPTASRMKFEDYSSPLPHQLFSADYFSELVFSEVAELQYPTIAPPRSVTSQNFSVEEPHSAAATLMSSLDVIPNVHDLLPTTSGMEDAYVQGMRSVLVKFNMGKVEHSYCYHFMKV